ncbi:PP2C family protein-serine/threonine phosphatase [Croceicoccus bisphenolivorans]|uniref:PP2C family protein-serine/threonine phosphatase n=1 Tax=Croceicoccus bisphenolivorans TaxID=1783232 RepID=UPI000AC594BF|nr:SpoIIE family protein phosphatase [Croceicoccus bisphenolivorans]
MENGATANGIAEPGVLKALVVDDDPMMAEFIAIEMERLGCRAETANDFDAALGIVARGVDMVVTDFQMPGRDGMELVAAIRGRDQADAPLHIVMMTARGEEAVIRRAVDAGVDDFLYKPVDPLQLMLAVASARRAVRLHHVIQERNAALASAHDAMRDALAHLQDDIDAAAGLHERLLPRPERLPGIRVAHVYKPAASLGGDSIGASDVGNGRIMFFVIDVQGHGVQSSLDSFHFHHRLKQMRPTGPDELAQTLASLNREILETESETYATVVAGLVDPAAGQGWLICAGHPPAILFDGNVQSIVETGGAFPLGWFPDSSYTPTPFSFGPQARLAVYSDGLSDCRDRRGRELGDEGIARLLAECRTQPIETVGRMVELTLSLRDADPSLVDDISLLVIEPDLGDRQAP